MGIGQKELFQEVEQSEGSSQLVAQAWLLGPFGSALLIDAGSTGLRGCLERQQLLELLGAVGYQLPRPLRGAEEWTASQHDIGEHT